MDFSLVVPFFERPHKVTRCLQSLAEISHRSLEVILVDDGSSIETTKVVQDFISRYQSFRMVRQEHSGVSAARNLGVADSRGRFVLFVDSDDYVDSKGLGAILDRTYEEDTLYLAGFDKRWNSGELIQSVRFEAGTEARSSFLERVLRSGFDRHLVNPVWNKVYSRKLLETAGLFDASKLYGEDIDLNLRVLASCAKVQSTSHAYYNYVIDPHQSLSTSFYEGALEQELDVIFKLRELLVRSGLQRSLEHDFPKYCDTRFSAVRSYYRRYVTDEVALVKKLAEIDLSQSLVNSENKNLVLYRSGGVSLTPN